ncbi:regulator of G-protein signaling 12-like isoform X2 [Dendronephthya gigantea]|uniref:regulator of G-protein signaling 12-like isoform X2 n=1 Tax=Dendronephthya gigantea TaxID=151771 RepID=UPI00106984B4|nr:regulator of G-protein signaling 12-like isoform X2 [Dendronephthya gigantea]
MSTKHGTKVFRVLTDGDDRFGFTLIGQYPCQLVKIQHGSPAEKAGIREGDELIEVNGVNVEDLKHNCVATFITPGSDGVTELRIRRLLGAKTLKSGHNVHRSVSEDLRTRNCNDLSHAVDRIVEGLKEPDVQTSTKQKGPDLTVLHGYDVASDEDLKANFSPVRTSTNTILTADISSPITLNLKLNNGLSKKSPSLKVLVGYLGSIKRPMITNCSMGSVTHLHVKKSSSVWVLLEIGSSGIYVRNSSKQIIMMSSLNSLVYFGICRENKQIFALFTADLNSNASNESIDNDVAITSDCNLNCSCHVFVIKPCFVRHENHKILMDSFQLPCDPTTGSCQRSFPTSSNTILNALQDILQRSLTQIASTNFDYSNVNSYGTEVEILRELGVITPQELIKSDHLCSLLDGHIKSQQDGKEAKQILCLYLLPLHSEASMKDKETDYRNKEDYNLEICGKEQAVTIQQSGSTIHTSHHNNSITTSSAENTNMAGREFFKPHEHGKVSRTGHKTLIHQRSHSLASNVKNALQAQAAAAAVVAATQTVECYNSQDLQIGNGVRQLYHASSSTVLAGNTIKPRAEGKVARWAVSFDRLLEDKTGLDVFRSFLKKEFSEENLIFWLACEKFKTLEDEKELTSKAKEIYEEHLKPCASLPVNVDSTAIKDVEGNLETPSSELFSSLQYQVYTLMKFDSYARFLKSELYRQCVVCEMEGKPLPVVSQEEKKEEEEGTSTLKRMFSSTKGKGRKAAPKSQTSIETDDSKKKSILPWRGRLKSDQPKRHTNRSSDSQASSTRSSLSSLSDSVFSSNITNSDEALNDSDGKEQAPPSCKVILPDSSLMYLFCKSTRSLKEGLSKLCENKEYSLPSLDVYLADRKLTKEDLQKKLTRFINKEIILKQKILFRLELPKDRTIGIQADEEKSIEEILEPILQQSGLDIKEHDIYLRTSNEPLSTSASVSLLHRQHVIVREKSVSSIPSSVKPALTAKEHLAKAYAQNSPTKSITAIDHKVFEGIMTGKRQSMSGFRFDDTGVFVPVVKLQSSGSREALTVAGQDKISRSPALFRKTKRSVRSVTQSTSTFRTYLQEDKKNTEEFFVLLHRSQNSRMDDQRGLLDHKKIQLPDFLKTHDVPSKTKPSPFSVGVPSPRSVHQPLQKTTSSPPSYATWVNKLRESRPKVINEGSRETLSRFTRNWSGSAQGRAKVHIETVTETQTIDRKRFFKSTQNETAGRLRAGSLPYTHPDDRCYDPAGVSELRTRNRYHYESETSLNNNTEVVWVSNTLNKNRMRASNKMDRSGDAGYESTTDDEGGNFQKTEVIIPKGITNADRFAVSGSVVPLRDRAVSEGPYFCENMATARRHVRTLAEQSAARDLTSGNDRGAILDNSFLRDELKPSRLFSQLTPEQDPPPDTSSPRNGTPLKCPLFIPPGNSYSTAEHLGQTNSAINERAVEPRVCWEASEQKNEEVNVRVTFV